MHMQSFLMRLLAVLALVASVSAWGHPCFHQGVPVFCPIFPTGHPMAGQQAIPDGSETTGFTSGNFAQWRLPDGTLIFIEGTMHTAFFPPVTAPPPPVVPPSPVPFGPQLPASARETIALGEPNATRQQFTQAPSRETKSQTAIEYGLHAALIATVILGQLSSQWDAVIGHKQREIAKPAASPEPLAKGTEPPANLETVPQRAESTAQQLESDYAIASRIAEDLDSPDPERQARGLREAYASSLQVHSLALTLKDTMRAERAGRRAPEPQGNSAAETGDFLFDGSRAEDDFVDQVLGGGARAEPWATFTEGSEYKWEAKSEPIEPKRSGTRSFYVDEKGIWVGGKPPAIRETYEETINRMWSDGMLTPEEQAWIDRYEEAQRRSYEMEFHAPFVESPYFSEKERRAKIRYEAEMRARGTISASTANSGSEAVLSSGSVVGVTVPSELLFAHGSDPSRSDLVELLIGTSPPPVPQRGRSFTIDESGKRTYTDEREHAAWQAQEKAARQIVLDLASDDPARQEVAKENLRFANAEVKGMALSMATNWGISQAQTIADAIAASLSITALSAPISF